MSPQGALPKGRRLESKSDAHSHPPMHGYGVAVRKGWWRRLLDLARRRKGGERTDDPPAGGLDGRGHSHAGDQAPASEVLKLDERLGTVSETLQKVSERLDRLDKELDDLRLEVRNQVPPPSPSQPGSMQRSEREQAMRSYEDLPKSQASDEDAPSRGFASVTSEDFEYALTRALAGQSLAVLEIDPLLEEVRSQVGNMAVEVEILSHNTAGQWQIAILWLSRPADRGFALVASGGLADAEAVKFFAVEYGRRIFSCLEPARVSRNGKDVLRKGRVEGS
jgi:hypothetical protein